MNKIFLTLSLLIINILCSCHKEQPAPFTFVIHNGIFGQDPSNYKQWVIIHSLTGEIMHVKNVVNDNKQWNMSYSTTEIGADQICDVTIATLNLTSSHLSMRTVRHVPSGKNLQTDSYATIPDSRAVSAEISIEGMPQLEEFECIGTHPDRIYSDNPPPDFKVAIPIMNTGETGVMLRWKAQNENQYRSHWVDIPGTQSGAPLNILLSANDFSPEQVQHQLKFPYPAKWTAIIRGITDPAGLSKYANLASNYYVQGQPAIVGLDFGQPDNLNIQSYWVLADHFVNTTQTEFQWLFMPGEPFSLPATDFRITNCEVTPSWHISTQYEGDFDILKIVLFGNSGKVSRRIEGAADLMKECSLPSFPDSLRVQWPSLSGSSLVYTYCTDFQDINSFNEIFDADRSNTLWQSQLGYRRVSQFW